MECRIRLENSNRNASSFGIRKRIAFSRPTSVMSQMFPANGNDSSSEGLWHTRVWSQKQAVKNKKGQVFNAIYLLTCAGKSPPTIGQIYTLQISNWHKRGGRPNDIIITLYRSMPESRGWFGSANSTPE